MKVLLGYGKTTHFKLIHPTCRIFHVSTLPELRSAILSTKSLFLQPQPTLINTWFVFNFSEIQDLMNYDCFIEPHFPPTRTMVNNTTNAIKNMKSSMIKTLGGKSMIICSIPDKILERNGQPQLYHLQENETEEEWTSLQYLLALGDEFQSYWLSWKWGENKIISLPSLLQQYLSQS